MCLVCLVSLSFLDTQIADLLSNTIREDSSVTVSGSLFKIHELTPQNVLNQYLRCMLHCNHFLQFIEQLVLEHVCHGKLAYLDRI